VKIIYTKNKQEILVSDEDYAYLKQFNWRIQKGYAMRYHKKNISMHRELMSFPRPLHVDHINRNKLDNRRENLRLATTSQNTANSIKKLKSKKSKYRGVTIDIHGYYIVHLQCKYKKYTKCFKNEIDAAKHYDEKAKELFGEFAILNFKDSG
jgi:HNH endonuclease